MASWSGSMRTSRIVSERAGLLRLSSGLFFLRSAKRRSEPRIMIVCGLPGLASVTSLVADRRRRALGRRDSSLICSSVAGRGRAGGQQHDQQHAAERARQEAQPLARGPVVLRSASRQAALDRVQVGPVCALTLQPGRQQRDEVASSAWRKRRSEAIETHSSGPWWPAPTGPNSTAGMPGLQERDRVRRAVAPDRQRLALDRAADALAQRAHVGVAARDHGGRAREALERPRGPGSRGSGRGSRPGPGSGR